LSDHAHLERLGIPTVTFVLDAFEPAARAHARIHGNPELPLVVVPRNFLEDVDDDEVFGRDGAVFAQVIAALTAR
jgi:hypothetical protein